MNPIRFALLNENQKYWTDRWASQTNYRYWKDRASAEMTSEGVGARRLFYEGTLAYKSADFATAVQKYKDGLAIWKDLLEGHLAYRNDDANKKDTGLVVMRYLRALRQLGEPEPKDVPFKELGRGTEADFNVDPFDATEMLGVSKSGQSRTPQQGAPR